MLLEQQKYHALLYWTKEPGPTFRRLVERDWNSWQHEVAEAPWLRNWRKSDLYDKPGLTPGGFPAKTVYGFLQDNRISVEVGAIAQTVYSDVVWGFVAEKWLQFPWGVEPSSLTNKKGSMRPTKMQLRIMELQKLEVGASGATIEFDQQIQQQLGILIPVEFGDLDRWLEKVWLQANWDL